MLDYARQRVESTKINNIEYYLCDGKAFNFGDNSSDRIYMVTVIGEIENKDEYIKSFYRMLKPNGILSISELAGDPDKMTIDELRNLIEKHRFKVYNIYGNKSNYTINLKK